MIRPVAFRKNEQTAVNNYFQEDISITNAQINAKAQREFDQFVDMLRLNGVQVIVVDDNKENDTPSANYYISGIHRFPGTTCLGILHYGSADGHRWG